jgi:hypothetical protein
VNKAARRPAAQRIVVKVGTRLLTHEGGQLNLIFIERLVRELADLKNQGRQIVNLLFLYGAKKPPWEGTVVNKYSKERSEHRGGEDDNYRTYTEFTTVINTDAGKKRTIREKDSQRHMYDYLAVGDRVRFHPRFGTYEKYDKSKDRIIYCNICSMMNPIQNDRCQRCHNLLFK